MPPGSTASIRRKPPGDRNPPGVEFDTTATSRVPSLRPPPANATPSDDQETVIRRMPAAWEEEIAGAMRPQAWADDDDAETVIRKGPLDDALLDQTADHPSNLRTVDLQRPEGRSNTRPTASAGWIGLGGSVAAGGG